MTPVAGALDEAQSRRALLALAAGGLAVGCAPILVRLSEVGPLSTGFWRLALAIPPLLALHAAAPRTPGGATASPASLRDALIAAAPGAFLAVELSLWHLSLFMTTVANATLLVNMTPIFAALFGWALFRRTVSRTFMLGLALAVAGVVMLTGGGARAGASTLAGDAVALLAAMIYAGYFLSLGAARRSFSAASVMLYSTGAAAVLTLPLALFELQTAPATLAGWATLAALAWIVQAGGQGLVTFAIAWAPATLSSLAMLIQPVVAAALAWGLFGERLTALQIAGGAVVLGGILIAKRG